MQVEEKNLLKNKNKKINANNILSFNRVAIAA